VFAEKQFLKNLHSVAVVQCAHILQFYIENFTWESWGNSK